MSLKGTFHWYTSLHQGGRKAISFTLTCKNLLTAETFNYAIIDGTGQQRPLVKQLKLKPGESFEFNYDTCGWDWSVGDFFAILGKNNSITQRWDMNLSTYAAGECPACHGTHRCLQCSGSGMIRHAASHTISACTACHGTGICQQCYMPMRANGTTADSTLQAASSQADAIRRRKIAALQAKISELQSKVEKAEWDQRMMRRRGTDLSSHTAYSAQMQLKFQYERMLIDAQYELQQLEAL